MFNSLQMNSTTKAMLRCKQCKSIIFGQDHIAQFMEYDPKDLGKLKEFAHYKKFQGEAFFFLLIDSYDFYSSFKIDYTKSYRLEYHPFFMMHMLLIQCSKCNTPLGYQVETVNENTLWMEGRTLIDATKCSLIKDGKDEMQKVIKTCQSRLAKKLELVKQEQKKPQKDIRVKVIEGLEKIKLPHQKVTKESNKPKEDSQQKDKVSQDLKRRGVSVQSTRGQTSFNCKDDRQSVSNYTLHDFTFKTDDQSYRQSYGFKQFEDRTLQQNQMTESMVSISANKNIKSFESQIESDSPLKDYRPIELSYEMKEKLRLGLQHWREKTLKDYKMLAAYPIIQKIEEHMSKLDAYERLLRSKMVDQYLKMQKLNTMVRRTVLEEKDQEIM